MIHSQLIIIMFFYLLSSCYVKPFGYSLFRAHNNNNINPFSFVKRTFKKIYKKPYLWAKQKNNLVDFVDVPDETNGAGGFHSSNKKNSGIGVGGGNIKLKSLAPEYKPKNKNQELYMKFLNDPNTKIVLGIGPAGSGKTLFACYTAVQELKKGNVQKIIMTRPLISVDKEDIGYLPGNMVNKMDPWTRPIFDILLEFFSQRDIDIMIESGVIEISPLAYMRGRTFKRAFIIADEMQNSSPNQMLMMTTRIGLGTKLVITGDLKQSDRGDKDNGLYDFMKKLKKYQSLHYNNVSFAGDDNYKNCIDGICLVEMGVEDVERSPIVAKILDIYKENPAAPAAPAVKKKVENTLKYNISSSAVEGCGGGCECGGCGGGCECGGGGGPVIHQYNTTTTIDDCALIPLHQISRRLDW